MAVEGRPAACAGRRQVLKHETTLHRHVALFGIGSGDMTLEGADGLSRGLKGRAGAATFYSRGLSDEEIARLGPARKPPTRQ